MAPKASIPMLLAAAAVLFLIMALPRVPEPAAGRPGWELAVPAASDKAAPRKILVSAAGSGAGRTSLASKTPSDRRRQAPSRPALKASPAAPQGFLVMETAGADDAWWETPSFSAAPGRDSGAPVPSVKTRPPGTIGGSAGTAGTDAARNGDVPESSTLILLGIGLVALAWFGRRWMDTSSSP